MRTSKFSNLAVNKESHIVRRAFSLIELLVVIAIITILTALLFPVFATAQENSRESSTITHMQQIQSGLALYKLDNGQYPQVLFGYAPNSTTPMSDSLDIGKYNATFGSLYPTYVNDYHVFMSQDNPVDNSPTSTVTLDSTELGSCTPTSTTCLTGTQLNVVQRAFYLMDGFDISPRLANLGTPNQFYAGNSASQYQYVLRYQRDWTNIYTLSSASTVPSGDIGYDTSAYETYLRQLRWHSPPADSYVTSVTYHVPNANKVIVLFESGSAVKMTPDQYRQTSDPTDYPGYDDSTSCFNTVGGTETCSLNGTDNPAQFWKISNTQ